MIKKELAEVISHKKIADSIFELVLAGKMVDEMNEPGQFIQIKVADGDTPLLRRPISICDIDKEKNQYTVLYRAEGQGTKILATRKVGEKIDILGPIGNGFSVEEAEVGETALLVGGGIGVPPLYELSQQLVAKGVKVIHVLGFASEKDVFYEEEFQKLGDTHIVTVDGSHGHKGFVTDVIDQEGIEFDVLYSCGPAGMLQALEKRFEGRRAFISVEERMACGIGACFACVCHKKNDPTGQAYKKVCVDGPVFKMGEVVL